MAEFWKLALGYIDEPPPAPFTTRQEWLAQFDLSDDDADDGAWLCDPTGNGPRIFLQQVPEPKKVKNRLHLDVRVSAEVQADQRWAAVSATVRQLTEAGARVLRQFPDRYVVLADPEGNEFCVC